MPKKLKYDPGYGHVNFIPCSWGLRNDRGPVAECAFLSDEFYRKYTLPILEAQSKWTFVYPTSRAKYDFGLVALLDRIFAPKSPAIESQSHTLP
jgi:hypothetical protein